MKRKMKGFLMVTRSQSSVKLLVEAVIAMEWTRFGCICARIFSAKDGAASAAQFIQNHLLLCTPSRTRIGDNYEPRHHLMMG
jgi:hypothetical protein